MEILIDEAIDKITKEGSDLVDITAEEVYMRIHDYPEVTSQKPNDVMKVINKILSEKTSSIKGGVAINNKTKVIIVVLATVLIAVIVVISVVCYKNKNKEKNNFDTK